MRNCRLFHVALEALGKSYLKLNEALSLFLYMIGIQLYEKEFKFLFRATNFWLSLTKSLQTTILNSMKMMNNSPKQVENAVE